MKIDGCNATIRIQRAFYPPTANFEETPAFVEFLVQIENWHSTLTLPNTQFNALGIQKDCPLVHFQGRGSKTVFDDALIAELARGIANKTIERGYYFEKGGATILPDGSVCFLRGPELLGSCSRPYILAPEASNMRLRGEGISPTRFLPLLLASPPQVLLTFSYVILTSIRSLIIESGIDLQAVLYIVGGQGLGKTTLATRIAGIYECGGQSVGIVQAGSTHAAVNTLMLSLRDQPIVVDDLCLSISRDTAQKRVDLASKLIRQGTGCIPIIKQCGSSTVQYPCESGLILTAEFSLQNLSDLTRCIIVPIKKPLNLPQELTSDLIGDAVRYYLSWFAQYSDREVNRLHEAIQHKDKSLTDSRMATNYACLDAAFQSFICSLPDLDASSDLRTHILKKMKKAIAAAQEEHLEMIAAIKDTIPIGNLAFCILQGYQEDVFDLTDKIKKLNKHSGIIWKGDLCLRREALIQFVRMQAGYHDWTSNQITRALKDINALVLQEEDSATVHLTKDSPRVYRIRLNVLKENAIQY